MKKLLSLLAVMALFLTQFTIVNAAGVLSDIDQTHSNYTAIKMLHSRNIVSGYPDGTFQPERTINRAELLKILVGATGPVPTVDEYHDCFPDVTTEWFAPYVCDALQKGWVEGYPDGEFRPSQTVNKIEAMKMLVKSQKLVVPSTVTDVLYDDIDNGQWYAPFIAVAQSKDLLEQAGGTYGITDGMTRGEISENLYRALIVDERELDRFGDYEIEGPYLVTNVVDGDTVDVDANGETIRLRLIGIDTPETVHPSEPVGCFGPEASAKVGADLLNQYVMLESDSSQDDIDSYDRYLRYVVLEDGTNYNQRLVEEGYAFEYTYNSNPYKYQSLFIDAMAAAIMGKAGLWSPDTCDGEGAPVDVPVVEEDPPVVDDLVSENPLFYASSLAKTKYYCETDPAWGNLSEANLKTFESEQAVLDWMESVGKDLVLNQAC